MSSGPSHAFVESAAPIGGGDSVVTCELVEAYLIAGKHCRKVRADGCEDLSRSLTLVGGERDWTDLEES